MRFVNLCQSHCRESIENCELSLNTTPPHPQPTTHSFIHHPSIHPYSRNAKWFLSCRLCCCFNLQTEEETDRRTVSGTWYLPMIIPNDHHHTYVIRNKMYVYESIHMFPHTGINAWDLTNKP